MIAGYFAYKKDKLTIKRRLNKIIKIFLYAYILFFAFSFAFAVYNHQISDWMSKQFSWKTPIMYICFCTIDFAIPLWYLIAMIEVYVVWLLVVKRGKEQVLLQTIPVLFALQIILTIYCETQDLEWFWKTNFITRAMPWFLLGYFLHTEKAKIIRDQNNKVFVVLIFVGSLISITPTAFNFGLKFNVIGYIPTAIGLFCLARKFEGGGETGLYKLMGFIGKHLSLNIYIFHVIVCRVLGFICSALKIDTDSIIYLWTRPIMVLICSIGLSLLLFLISRKIDFFRVKSKG